MNNITSISDIKNAIVMLEIEQEIKAQQLRQQFQLTYEGLKPINLLKSAVQEISSTPHLAANILGASTGLALGFLTRKFVSGASGGMFRNLIGSAVQLGVAGLVARPPAVIQTFGRFVNRFFGRRKADAAIR